MLDAIADEYSELSEECGRQSTRMWEMENSIF